MSVSISQHGAVNGLLDVVQLMLRVLTSKAGE